MKSILGILFLVCLMVPLSLMAAIPYQADVSAGSRFLSNAYYEDVSGTGDLVMDIMPHLYLGEKDQDTGSYADLNARYSKFVSLSNLDFYGFDLEGQARLLDGESVKVALSAYARNESEAAINSESLVRYRVLMGGGGKLIWQSTEFSQVRLFGEYNLQTHDAETYQHLDAYDGLGGIRYSYFFLPETALFFEGRGGIKVYPNGSNPAEDVEFDEQSDSIFFDIMGGVEGRLSDTTSITAVVGFLLRDYALDADFAEPLFRLKFEEQLSPRDILVASFDYRVEDSYYTNFMVDQTISLGYGRILGDQILLLAKAAYSSLSFSLPNRREDQRMYGKIDLEYSYDPKIKFGAFVILDILNSDARENFTSTGELDDSPDPGASYETFSFGATAKYLF